jgi:hypothetical protein
MPDQIGVVFSNVEITTVKSNYIFWNILFEKLLFFVVKIVRTNEY